MSSALVKGKLKAAREAIGQKDWAKAERAAGCVVVSVWKDQLYRGRRS
jgi:hypothetical protein